MLRDRGLQFFHVNEEFPVSASHQLALITSLPFVHTARRYYRLNDRSEVFGLDARNSAPPGAGSSRDREDDRTRPFRGSKSRNKVSVGEPAEGSLMTGPTRARVFPVVVGPAFSRSPAERVPRRRRRAGSSARFCGPNVRNPRPRAFGGSARTTTAAWRACCCAVRLCDRSPARRDPPTDRSTRDRPLAAAVLALSPRRPGHTHTHNAVRTRRGAGSLHHGVVA